MPEYMVYRVRPIDDGNKYYCPNCSAIIPMSTPQRWDVGLNSKGNTGEASEGECNCGNWRCNTDLTTPDEPATWFYTPAPWAERPEPNENKPASLKDYRTTK